MRAAKIGLGMAALGRPDYINIRATKEIDKSLEAFKSNALEVLDVAFELGIRSFDVAPSYGLGEQFLLEWNKSRQHKDVKLSTKWGYTYVANWEIGFKGKHEIKEHSLVKLNEQWEVSKALQPNLDIYQIHSATLDSGVLNNTEVLKRLHQLKLAYGLKIGLTSSGTEQVNIIETANDITFDGVDLFDSYQLTFNAFEQSCYSVVKYLQASDKTIIVKEALANGRVFRSSNFPEYQSFYDYTEQLSKKYEVGVDAIALRFVMDKLNPTVVLSGASNSQQLKENLKALEFQLTSNEIETLKAFSVSPNDYWQERNNLHWN